MVFKLSAWSRSPGAGSEREMRIAREIAHAFLNAEGPAEVYRLALERVVQMVGAAFGCVFLRDGESDLLRVVAAHNWPEEFVGYLDTMRVRVGNGPTGNAVARGEIVEARDVFADPELEDWRDSARELGFVSSVAVPLSLSSVPVGAITLYFDRALNFDDTDRDLLRLVADQLSATAEKAHLIEDLQHANELLREQNIDLEARYLEAEEAKRLKNEFLANISHELRTPLTAILGYAYLLKEGQEGEPAADTALAISRIEAAGASLLELIDDLLDLTHLKLGRTTVEAELCDAVALMRAAMSAVPAPAELEIATEAPPSRVPIHTDPALVLRILQNLLSNAYKFTPSGSVTVRVLAEESLEQDRGGIVHWEVKDTGIGIAPESHRAIFDEFRQVDGSATRRFSGAGLGLALSQGLAERLGGTISLTSELGEGSTFTLSLPASVVHAGAPTNVSPVT